MTLVNGRVVITLNAASDQVGSDRTGRWSSEEFLGEPVEAVQSAAKDQGTKREALLDLSGFAEVAFKFLELSE
ncbi:MAG: hypothetical protein ABSF46_04075 [Terriglobia bacterium]